MAKYRKKPVVIEAEQFMGVGWYEANGKPYPKGYCICDNNVREGQSPHSHVHTIHDNQAVLIDVGDWILPEPDGIHYYPCKPGVFEATYELVEDGEGD